MEQSALRAQKARALSSNGVHFQLIDVRKLKEVSRFWLRTASVMVIYKSQHCVHCESELTIDSKLIGVRKHFSDESCPLFVDLANDLFASKRRNLPIMFQTQTPHFKAK